MKLVCWSASSFTLKGMYDTYLSPSNPHEKTASLQAWLQSLHRGEDPPGPEAGT